MTEKDFGNSLTEALANKGARLWTSEEQTRSMAQMFKARMKRLVAGQDQLRLNAGEEMSMGKAEEEETKKKIMQLQEEIGALDETRTLKNDELEKLGARLTSIEAMLPGGNFEQN